MVRIYCLTSIKIEWPIINGIINYQDETEEADIFPGENTKEALQNLKHDPQIFISYQLTEISIGHHFDGNQKIYLLLIFRKDTGLFVFKMIPGSVKFEEISKNILQFKVTTSTLFSKIVSFDLVIRIRCIKNTSVRKISTEETKYYEKIVNDIKHICNGNQDLQELSFDKIIFDLPKQSGSKVYYQKLTDIKTVVELLCDEQNGSIENVAENARYNQRANCYRLEENNRESGNRSRKRKSHSSFLTSADSSEGTFYDDRSESDFMTESAGTSSSEISNLTQSRGRPPLYSNEKERKRARVESSKKYTEQKEAEHKQLTNEITVLEKINQSLYADFNELFLQNNSTQPEAERLAVENLQFEKNNFETWINTKRNTVPSLEITVSYSRTEKQRFLVRRIREKQKIEREIVEKKYQFLLQQNEELKKRIENLQNFEIVDTVEESNVITISEDSEDVKFEQEVRSFNESSNGFLAQLSNSTPLSPPPPNQYYYEINITQGSDIPELDLNELFPKYANISTAPTSNFATLTSLQLQNVNLNEICECFFEKLPTSLTFLDLSFNNISFVSKSISKMKNLKTINLSNNELNFIPWDSLPQGIQNLNLSNSNLEKISVTNLRKLTILELQNANLSSLPIGFEAFPRLQYLNLSQNKFNKNLNNLEETLWKRLPSTLSILKLSRNDLGQIPCLLKIFKFKHLSLNNCNLSSICSSFLNQARNSKMILEIGGNWQLENLPIIPKTIYPPNLTKADPPNNLSTSINGLNLISDNESFINTSRFPTTKDSSNKPIYKFEECNDFEENNNCCKCCAICGGLKDKSIKQLMVMDFNLCLSTNFDENFKLNLFESGKNLDVKDILQELNDKIQDKMHLVYGPGNWKTEIITGLCLKCLKSLKHKIEEAALNGFINNANKMERQPENLIKTEEPSHILEMHF